MSGNGELSRTLQYGALLGALAGIVEGLLAVAPLSDPGARSALVLLALTLERSVLGAIAFPLILRLLGLVGPAAGGGHCSPLRTSWSATAVVMVAAPAAAWVTLQLLAVGTGLSWKVRAFAALLASVGLLAGVHRLLASASTSAAAAGSVAVLALAAAVLAPVLVRGDVSRIADGILRKDGVAAAPERTSASGPDRPNILFVVLDTTRRDHLSLYGYPRPTTPFLEELARDSMVFERAISTAPWTLPSHGSMFSGQPPAVHGATKDRFWLPSDVVTVAERLHDAGYATLGLSSASMVSSQWNMHQGFERFYEVYRQGRSTLAHPAARLAPVSATALVLGDTVPPDKGARLINRIVPEWLDEREERGDDRPFLIFVNMFEAHLPYEPPEPYWSDYSHEPLRPRNRRLAGVDFTHGAIFRAIGMHREFLPEDYAQLGDLYDASLAYQDDQLRTLIGELESRGVLQDTMILITSDHGEHLGEQGGLLGHAFSVHQELLRVPLLARFPGHFEAGARYEGLVSTLSVYPTLLDVAGVPASPDWAPSGPPLPRELGDPPLEFAVSEYGVPVFELYMLVTEAPGVSIAPYALRQASVQNHRWKLIVPSSGATALYDLENDPGEMNPLLPIEYEVAAELKSTMDDYFASLPPTEVPALVGYPVVDEQTRRALEAMGYMQ